MPISDLDPGVTSTPQCYLLLSTITLTLIGSKFPTSRLEMNAVADIFDRNGDGYIDYKEFINSLRPERERSKPVSDTEKIEDEVKSQVAKCTCPQRYR